MTFPKFHGLRLAGNSFIENLQIEKLTEDPANLVGSRIWHNTTEGTLKFSVIESGQVITHAIFDRETATSALNAINATVTTNNTTLSAALTTETNARISAIETLALAVTAEQMARATADTEAALKTAADLQAETNARILADQVASSGSSDQLATETAARLAGDQALDTLITAVQAEVNATQAGAGLAITGAYVAESGSAYIAAATSLANAAVLLDTALSVEATTRATADTALQAAVTAEAQLRADGDTALENRITAFVNGQMASNEVQDQAEMAARIAADAAIQAELDLTQASVGVLTDGSLAAITGSNYINAATTVMGAVGILDGVAKRIHTDLISEVATRTSAVAGLAASLQTEATTRTATDLAQQQEIDNIEAGAGLETNGTYAAPTNSNYLNTSASLKDADFKLDAAVKGVDDKVVSVQGEVAAEVARALAAEGALSTRIDNASTSSSAATVSLKNAINATVFNVKTVVPQMIHVITHGLAAEFIQWSLLVQAVDGTWANDIVGFTEIDNNTVRVELSESSNIKLSIKKMDALA